MNIDNFASEWEASNNDLELEQIREYWDTRADEFNAHKKSNYDYIIDLLEQRGMINSYNNILDIGCGPGKLSLIISTKVNSITGIDISTNMINLATMNSKERENVNFKVASWEEIDLDEEDWTKKFDVVIASMSPGIKNVNTLSKMIEASKKYCLISSYVYRRDLRNELEEYLGEKKKESGTNKIYYIFNILWNLGYYPEIFYQDIEIINEYTYEKALEIYSIQFAAKGKKLEMLAGFLRTKMNEDKKIIQKYNAKIGWLLVETKTRK